MSENAKVQPRSSTPRPFVRRGDGLLLALLLLLALGAWWWAENHAKGQKEEAGAHARVLVGHEVVLDIPLVKGKARTIPVPGRPAVILFLDEEGRLAFRSSDCPDQICVHSGLLSLPGQMAACLPNEVFVRIEAVEAGTEEAEHDVVLGGGR